MGAKSRRKGANNELALAKLFRAWWGAGEWARTPLSGGWSSPSAREAFRTCGDIITTEQGFPFCVEAKQAEGWTLDHLLHNEGAIIRTWWAQAAGETPPGMLPLLIAGRNRIPRVAIFDGAALDRLAKSRGYNEPVAPWGTYAHFIYMRDLLEPALVIVPLSDFFKIPPTVFGEVTHAEQPPAAGPPAPERPAERSGTDGPRLRRVSSAAHALSVQEQHPQKVGIRRR